MSDTMKTPSRPVSNSDSFFGMALAQAFVGFAFGPAVDQLWEAGEIVSAAYEDRTVPKRANGRVYEMGVKKSLADDFSRTAQDWKTLTAPFFKPAPAPSFAF